MSQRLREHAIAASRNAYAPHSHFHVGAALRSARGAVYVGCNVENASYSVTSCAERGAISAAIAAEGNDFRLEAIAIVACNESGDLLPVTPCGACRQILIEFGEQAEAGFTAPNGDWQVVRVADLLPYRFVLTTAPTA